MTIFNSISRLATYVRRRGVAAALLRAGVAAKRAFSGRMVLFYCDLLSQSRSTVGPSLRLTVERHHSRSELAVKDLEEITSFWDSRLARRNLEERFHLGASLWLVKLENRLAGYGWTLQGATVEPHYFPLGRADIHLFDFHVFAQFRGRGINPFFVDSILKTLAEESRGRAFIEAAEWNSPQLASLSRTPFRCLGIAKKFTICGRTVVYWARTQAVENRGIAASSATAQSPPRVPGLQF